MGFDENDLKWNIRKIYVGGNTEVKTIFKITLTIAIGKSTTHTKNRKMKIGIQKKTSLWITSSRTVVTT